MTGHQGVWSSNFGYAFASEPQGEPCPRCGTTSRTYGVVQSTIATGTASSSRTVGKKRTATARGYPDWEGRAIPPGRGRSAYFQRNESGYEFLRKTRRWHLRERLVDRRCNRYREYIEDAETGEWLLFLVSFYLAKYFAVGFAFVPIYTVLVNRLTHAIASLALWRYNPGLYTTLLLFFPWGIFLLVYFNAATETSLVFNVICVLVGIVGHAIIVVYALRRRSRLKSGSHRGAAASP